MDTYGKGCPDPGFGSACKSHTEELLDLSRRFRDAINETENPDVYKSATDQLDCGRLGQPRPRVEREPSGRLPVAVPDPRLGRQALDETDLIWSPFR